VLHVTAAAYAWVCPGRQRILARPPLADPGYGGAGTGIRAGEKKSRAGEKKFGAPEETRTGAPSLGPNVLREILGIIIILIGTNSFLDI
jgi:hypothetical protein